jgi:hypothetical protein
LDNLTKSVEYFFKRENKKACLYHEAEGKKGIRILEKLYSDFQEIKDVSDRLKNRIKNQKNETFNKINDLEKIVIKRMEYFLRTGS